MKQKYSTYSTMISKQRTLLIAWLFYLAKSVHEGRCELYTSADELSKWSQVGGDISGLIQDMIEDHEMRLKQLRRIQSSISPLVGWSKRNSSDNSIPQEANEAVHGDKLMMSPVSAFVVIHRLQRAIEGVEQIFSGDKYIHSSNHIDGSEFNTQLMAREFLQKLRSELPLKEDLLGSARALLRLQAFYDLKMHKLVDGIIESNSPIGRIGLHGSEAGEVDSLKMTVWDCFELGKIAFREDLFGLAVQWLLKSLEMIYEEETNECEHEEFNPIINEILDYMAFAAYKLNMVAYSANLTRIWLDREPDNERARENLEYYLNLLSEKADEHRPISEPERLDRGDASNYPYLRNGIEHYSLTDDQIVRHLCRDFQKFEPASSSRGLKCERSGSLLTPEGRFSPGLRSEILSDEPRVLRLHEIITEEEAAHLRGAARPLLERSTVNSADGLKTSDFRIAKTAWLSGANDELVRRVEHRLSAALNLNMESSEHLQVVNYGLGGFYGPHLDSARKRRPQDQSVMLSELHQNDRFATVLIYLSRVDAGGATVFPRLNLTVAPIERSAVAWFNILPSGHSDERTLHTGCPVLLGSKWIATKWPRERANAFTQPCTAADAPAAA